MQVKVALAVSRQAPTRRESLAALSVQIHKAAMLHADLVVFPEAALTGLTNNDDPRHDLKLGVAIPGPETRAIAAVAKRSRMWVAVGLLERSAGRLYDSAVLMTAEGRIRLKYRRISPGWHGSKADRHVYGHGRTLKVATTPFGAVGFLICGDLFDSKLVRRIRRLGPDLLIVPLARCFDDGSRDQSRWDRDEKPAYFEQARRCGACTLLVNALDRQTRCFGGAWAVSCVGEEIASLPLGRPGMVVVSLDL
jgi:predicted amidohydrolase